jgi:hypothetical protein
MNAAYEEKFAGLLRLCKDAKQSGAEVVVIHSPEVLGDNYDELIESLNRISDAKLSLTILPRSERATS